MWATPAPSMDSFSSEYVCVGRRRSLSLDDLGMGALGSVDNELRKQFLDNDTPSEPQTAASNVDDTDDDLEDLPSQEETPPSTSNEQGEAILQAEACSLSTIREASPLNSAEEWSPSPVMEEDNTDRASLTSLDNRSAIIPHEDQGKTRSHPAGFVHNCITKWKNIIKK